MKVRLERSTRRPRLALFVSKYDHCLADLLYRWHSGELRCEVVAIVGNHQDAEPLAQFYKVPFHHVPVAAANKASAETQQLALLRREHVDLIVLARYMQVLSPRFVAEYPQRIINVHHSFLPAFIGAKPYHQAHERGVKLIGATSHYVTEQLDDGPIIEQSTSRISHRDQLPELLAKGRELEKRSCRARCAGTSRAASSSTARRPSSSTDGPALQGASTPRKRSGFATACARVHARAASRSALAASPPTSAPRRRRIAAACMRISCSSYPAAASP